MNKVFSIGLVCAFGLSGCAMVEATVQNAYDNKARKECTPKAGEIDTIHRPGCPD